MQAWRYHAAHTLMTTVHPPFGTTLDVHPKIAARLGRLRGVRDMPVYALVEGEVASFLDSLPLMRALKSDALRPRHWRALMAATGREFDMDARTFTLGSMFAMQLHKVWQITPVHTCHVHQWVAPPILLCWQPSALWLLTRRSWCPTFSMQYAEDVGKITNAAAKELVIETELRKLADLWKEQRFTMHKYTNVSQSSDAPATACCALLMHAVVDTLCRSVLTGL